MSKTLSRRHFLGGAMAATLAARAAEAPVPTRVLGRTGARVPIVAFGCGSRLSMYGDEERGVEAINLALDLGINYIDAAHTYGNGRSETWAGQVMKRRRKGVFLISKLQARDADGAMRQMDISLKRLQTDHVDLLHIHGLEGEDDLARIEAKDGLLNVMYKLRDQKVARFIGITSHLDPAALKLALERHDFDCVQMALNAALQGMIDGRGKMIINPAMKVSFETVALPVAKKKNLGVLAMKVAGQDDLVGEGGGKAPMDKLLQYALSLPIAAAVIGMPKLEHIRQNVALARAFKPMSKSEMKDFSRRMSEVYKAALDRKFARHVDV